MATYDDARSVLKAAQAALEARRRVEVAFTSYSTFGLEDGKWSETITLPGVWLLDGARESLRTWATPSRPQETQYGFDGDRARVIQSAGEEPSGHQSDIRRVFPPEYGSLVLFGHLSNAGGKEGPRGATIFEHLLAHAHPDTLTLVPAEDVGKGVVHIHGELPWGEYDVAVDLVRGKNMVRFVAELTEPRFNMKWCRYKLEQIELKKVGDLWVPSAATMSGVHELDPSRVPEGTPLLVPWRIDVYVDQVRPNDGLVGPDSFRLDWPVGMHVYDDIMGFSYTVLEGGEVINPLDRMVMDLAGGADSSSDSEVQSVALSDASKISLPSDICAIGCAYAVFKMEGESGLTTRQLMDELQTLPSGRVAVNVLIEVFKAHGFHTTVVEGLDGAALRAADRHDGVHVLLLMEHRQGAVEPAAIDHVMLYRGTTAEGQWMLVDPPNVTTRPPDWLHEQWRKGIALIVAK